MLESFLTVAVVGLVAGIIFSMPVAGPISIIIISKALEGKLRFCLRTAIGAAIVEFIYVFIAVFGIAALYSFYQPIIPYLLLVGAIFVVFIGYKILRKKIDFDTIGSEKVITDKLENKGGLRTGIVLNLTNPSLFIGWLMASFITFSFAASLGFNVGGMDVILNENVSSVSEIAGTEFENLEQMNPSPESPIDKKPETLSLVLLSLSFALSVGAGALIWLYQLARFIIHYRDKLNIKIINGLINFLGIILMGIGCYLAVKSFQIFFS
jgi:threonine/homoserine/homoserine lactone efflux protein